MLWTKRDLVTLLKLAQDIDHLHLPVVTVIANACTGMMSVRTTSRGSAMESHLQKTTKQVKCFIDTADSHIFDSVNLLDVCKIKPAKQTVQLATKTHTGEKIGEVKIIVCIPDIETTTTAFYLTEQNTVVEPAARQTNFRQKEWHTDYNLNPQTMSCAPDVQLDKLDHAVPAKYRDSQDLLNKAS
ncbi:hypothetical protein PR048_011160 [Dryococelus australis]|uniref:Uncharacterized protein n=1 Tax=Dryococelus australis TaxID=614101 RepID=A0ABQ9HLC8_9NEOP|nr:hypothetical protein PR048_011160 [Dryococelus australis]